LLSEGLGAICVRLLSKAWNPDDFLGISPVLILISLATIVAVSVLGIVYTWKLGLF
jgi:hypothetical protein